MDFVHYRITTGLLLVWCLCDALAGACTVQGAEKAAYDLLPPTTVGYLEIPQPQRLFDLVLDHPAIKQLEQHPAFQQAYQNPQFEKLLQRVNRVEEKLGEPWRPALHSLLGGGMTIGVDLPTQGLMVLLKAKDEQFATKAYHTFYDLAREEAAENKPLEPVKQDDYRGVANYRITDVEYAVLGSWIAIANKAVLLRFMIDTHLDGGSSLANDHQFQAARKERAADLRAWLYVDLRTINLLGVLQKALPKKSNNPGVELLVGGIIGALPGATHVTASLDVDARHVKLSAALPGNKTILAKTREFYFGPAGVGTAPPLLRPKETLFTLSTYRDFFSLWRNAPDLFDDKVNAKFAESESGLTTLFAGRNFRDDILGNLEPGVQLVFARQNFSGAEIIPAIKLPSGALVFRMKKPEETTRIFKITYQSIIGFLNIVGAMNGLAPLDLNSEKTNFGLLVSAEYFPPARMEKKHEAPMNFNASPTVAFVGDRFILASSKALAQELAELAVTSTISPEANSAMELKGPTLRQVLADNREPLVAKNMLDKGHDHSAAEKEIDLLMMVVQAIEEAKLSLVTDEKIMRLSLEVIFVPNK